MAFVCASEFGTRVDFLRQRKVELQKLLDAEFHPKRIHGLIDQIKSINSQIRMEERKYTPRGI